MDEQLQLFVKPVEGRRVKDPVTMRVLAPDGEWKPAVSFWHRRVLEGDVTDETERALLLQAPEPEVTEPKQRKAKSLAESKED